VYNRNFVQTGHSKSGTILDKIRDGMWGGQFDGGFVTQHPDKALSAVRINAIKREGRYADGNGLYLVVDEGGAKRWLLRTVVQGRRRDLGLGSLRLVSLAEARVKARHYRAMAREGGDPLAAKRKAQAVVPTFAQAAARAYAAGAAIAHQRASTTL
jgi:hypothetical protein